jgi:hypothetical protein
VEGSVVVAPVAFVSPVVCVPLPPASAVVGLAVQSRDDSDNQSGLRGISGLVKPPRTPVQVIYHLEQKVASEAGTGLKRENWSGLGSAAKPQVAGQRRQSRNIISQTK